MVRLSHQEDMRVFMFVANLHALTEFHNAEAIRKNTLTTVKTYLACGLDPKQVLIYNQSDISAHTQLMRVLACVTNM